MPDRTSYDAADAQVDRRGQFRLRQPVGVHGQLAQTNTRCDRDRELLARMHIDGHGVIPCPLRDRTIPQGRCRKRDVGNGKELAVRAIPKQILLLGSSGQHGR